MTLCSVKWCLAEAAPSATVCAIHRKHPDFKPEELDVKAGHFEVEASWLVKPCADCDGEGRCHHGGQCDHCMAEIDASHECGFCEGDGKRETCSICGHQVGVAFAMTDKAEHETKCWVPAVKPQAVAS